MASFNMKDYPKSSYDVFNGNYDPDFMWTIVGVEELKRRREVVESELSFPWRQYPGVVSTTRLSLDHSSGLLTVSLHLLLVDPCCPLKPIPTVYYVLRDRRENGHQHLVRAHSSLSASPTLDRSMTFARKLCHISRLDSVHYNLSDDSVVIEVYVEAAAAARAVGSHDGSLTFALDHYARRKMAEEAGLVERHESPYFYTAPGGFRVQAWLGLGQEDGIKFKMAFLSGVYDRYLPLCFPHQVTIAVANPRQPELSLVGRWVGVVDRRLQEAKIASLFVPIKGLDSIENDSLFISIVISPAFS